MLEHTDDLNAVAKAYERGEVAAEDVHIHVAPRLELVPDEETRRLLNDLELAVYTLAEPGRKLRVLEILAEASRVAVSYMPPGTDEV